MPQKNLLTVGSMGPITAAHNDSEVTGATYKGADVPFPYYINGYFEVDKTKGSDDARRVAFTKRPGFGPAPLTNITLAHTYDGYKIQGITASLDKTKLLFYINNTVSNRTAFYDGTTMTISGANAPAAAGNWTFTGPVVWTILDGIAYGANVYYAVTDFTKGAVVDAAGTWTEIVDADFTGLTKVTNFVGLDGYLFIGTSNNRIYNSDLNTSTSWLATSFLSAADVPGSMMWLGRVRNYLVAFKQYSIEFFENTGNPTPGSPLTAQKALRKSVGLASKSSVQYVSDGIIFMGQTEQGHLGIYKLRSDDLSLEKVSDYFIDSVLNVVNNYTNNSTYSVDSMSDANGTALGESRVVTFYGKEFYLIDLTGMGQASRRTYVLDNELKVWTTWNTWFKTSGTASTGCFDPSQAVPFTTTGGTGFGYCVMVNNYSQSVHPNNPPSFGTFNMANNGYVCFDNDSFAQPQYPFVWVGDVQDFGTRKRKFLDSVEILMEPNDEAPGTAVASMTLYYRDANFNNTGTGTSVARTINYRENSSLRAIARRLGTFRKRQFSLLDQTSLSLKIYGIECQYNVGEQDQEG